jgi:hypothetical protein
VKAVFSFSNIRQRERLIERYIERKSERERERERKTKIQIGPKFIVSQGDS